MAQKSKNVTEAPAWRGRPKIQNRALVKRTISVKIPGWLNDWLNEQDQAKAQLIEEALRKVHKLKPPR